MYKFLSSLCICLFRLSYLSYRFLLCKPPVYSDLPSVLPTVTNKPLPGSRDGSGADTDAPSAREKFNTAAICPLDSTGIFIMFTMGSGWNDGLSDVLDDASNNCKTPDDDVADGDLMLFDSDVDTTSNVGNEDAFPESTEGGDGFTMFTSPTGNICGGGESILIGKSIDATGLVTGTVTVSTSLLTSVRVSA